MHIPRPEYPRPQFERKQWVNLNGEWQFEIDQAKSGRERGLHTAESLKETILVPFCPESSLSGIGFRDFIACVWYRRTFRLPQGWTENGRRTLLNFGACDYRTEVYVNGRSVGNHRGGMASFYFDITSALADGENVVTICAEDDTRSPFIPSGKQSSAYHSNGASYTRTTGIWQTVWLENVPDSYIVSGKFTPDIDHSVLQMEIYCENAHGMTVSATAFYQGKVVAMASGIVNNRFIRMDLRLNELHLWNIGDPQLYQLKLKMGADSVDSYFGMRSLEFHDQKLKINGKKIFQRLILDQGFYPEGLYTAPSDEDLQNDIRRSQKMGFNGARLHQKVFEPRFLYHCDRMGYIVWGEFYDWGLDLSRPEAWKAMLPEWLEILKRDYNHPAIIGWCPTNEVHPSRDPELLKMVIDLTRVYDSTRPVQDTSGMTHEHGLSDMWDIHDYDQDPVAFKEKYEPLQRGEKIVFFNFYTDAAPFEEYATYMSEYGGIRWNPDDPTGWGYGQEPKTEEEFLQRFKGLTDALLDNPAFSAFCYTQLTDIEQEVNGLYTYSRIPKFPPEIIFPIVSRQSAYEKEL